MEIGSTKKKGHIISHIIELHVMFILLCILLCLDHDGSIFKMIPHLKIKIKLCSPHVCTVAKVRRVQAPHDDPVL